jgi:hypothetical protein
VISATHSWGGAFRLAALAVGWWVAGVAPVAAQTARQCETSAQRPFSAAHGRPIREITVHSEAPDRLPFEMAAALHVTTREHVIRSRLLFSVGDRLDSLRVAESLRQLRALRFLAGASIRADCDTAGATVTVTTRDSWSMWPRIAYRGASRSSAGLEELNLFGTGRSVQLYVRGDDGQVGIGGSYADPTLLGHRAVGVVSHDAFRHGSGWQASLHTLDRGVFAPWGFTLAVGRSTRQSVTRGALRSPGDSVRRNSAVATISRRVTFSPSGALLLMTGIEAERTALAAGPGLPVVGPTGVRRTLVAADIGLARRSAQFVDAPWLLPVSSDRALRTLTSAELPVGIEFEGMLGLGRELSARRPAAHLDVWAGRQWALGLRSVGTVKRPPAALLSADAWVSGYYVDGSSPRWSAGTVRASIGAVAPARRGLWSARISGELLSNPDPDVRSLALSDPAIRAVPGSHRLAESALTGSVERTIPVRTVNRTYALDFALFGAGSMRWDAARAAPLGTTSCGGTSGSGASMARDGCNAEGPERLAIGSVGAGLRLTPTQFGRATIRLDIGFPIVRSAAISPRPYFGVSVAPAFGSGRLRAPPASGTR